jgi:hypothetical protein
MELNSVTIITILVLLFFCIFPIVFINQKRKNKMKKSLQLLQSFAEENNCKISDYESFNLIIIGIDKDAHQLFFIRTTPGNNIQQKINLPEIKKCRMEETGRTVNTIHVIEKIDLAFSSLIPNQKEVAVNIYHADYDNLTLSGELQFAEKWAQKINDHLITINSKK